MHTVSVKDILIGKGQALVLIAGPCVIESEALAMSTAEFLKGLCEELSIPLIFKSSFDKANRLSVRSFRGNGRDEGLKILQKVQKTFDLPVLTDIHSAEDAVAAAEVCDVLQIPAFLCRQTDLLLAAGETGRAINVKKGQFMAPWDMRGVVEKIRSTGNENIILTERGFSFGYNNLIVDMRSIPAMQELGFPVCFDATHAVQLPGGKGESSGGERKYVPTLSAAAIAAGCNCIFIEAHPDPVNAQSDRDSQMPLDQLRPLLQRLKSLYSIVNEVGVCC